MVQGKILKLLVESEFHDYDVMLEQASAEGKKSLKLRGPYIVAGTENANKRNYDPDVTARAVDRYDSEFIKTSRSMGELNHSPSVEVDPQKACHLVTDLKRDGNVWIGTSKVLVGTPMGDLLAGLIQNGVKIGMSTRGAGNLNSRGVVDEYKLISIDAVWNPSGPGCMAESLYESRGYMLDNYGNLQPVEQAYDRLGLMLSHLPKKSEDKNQAVINAFDEFFKSLKS